MELKVIERVLILACLPAEEDIMTLRIVRDLKRDLSFSEEEHKTLGLEMIDGGMRWKVDLVKDVEIGEKGSKLISEALKKLDREKKLTENHIPLWEKFVEVGKKEGAA